MALFKDAKAPLSKFKLSYYASFKIKSLAFSPIIIAGALVFPLVMRGIIEAVSYTHLTLPTILLV